MKAQLHCAKANLYVIMAKLICLNKFVTLTQSGYVILNNNLIEQIRIYVITYFKKLLVSIFLLHYIVLTRRVAKQSSNQA